MAMISLTVSVACLCSIHMGLAGALGDQVGTMTDTIRETDRRNRSARSFCLRIPFIRKNLHRQRKNSAGQHRVAHCRNPTRHGLDAKTRP